MIIRESELYHFGIPGMKWGHRKAIVPVAKTGRRSRQSQDSSSAERQQQAHAKRKKALKVGAAVAGTALAAYGTYKLSKYVQNKRSQAAMKKAQDYIDSNFLNKMGETTWKNGSKAMYFENKSGMQMTFKGNEKSDWKAVGKKNAETVAKARQIYKDSTNSRLDRGLSRITNAGDSFGNSVERAGNYTKNVGKSIGNSAKRAGKTVSNSVRRQSTNAKNRVLDVVNPVYEYVPGASTTSVKRYGDVTMKKTVQQYNKVKKRRG